MNLFRTILKYKEYAHTSVKFRQSRQMNYAWRNCRDQQKARKLVEKAANIQRLLNKQIRTANCERRKGNQKYMDESLGGFFMRLATRILQKRRNFVVDSATPINI